jgi:predicted aldo/keto reductase-like oxidoreductase
MQASIIGLGTEHLDGKPYETIKGTLDAAIENGVNIMDVFMPGHDIRQKLGKALKGRREKMIIQGHLGSTDVNHQYDISRDMPTVKKYFESLLTDLDTDYIDVGMLFFIDSEEHFNAVFHSDFIEYARQLKQSGTIRAIGASSHNPVIAKKMVETGLVELLMFSINPAFDMVPANIDVLEYLQKGFEKGKMLAIDEKRLELYRLCEQRSIPITVMKTFAGGKLLSGEHTPFAAALTPRQCIHYALTRPGVASALVGCQSRAEVLEAVSYLDSRDEELDFTAAISGMNENFKGSCVYCSHCLPCLSHIDIAAVHKYLDIALADPSAAGKGIGQHYRELSAHGRDCIACGSCESKCPFSVPIIENMKKAAKVFAV